MTAPLKSTTLDGFGELNRMKPQFLSLFEKVFGRDYPLALWEHYYKDNPCGPPRAAALWDKDRLVGFAALLMQEIVNRETGALIPFGYNVTAMIDSPHRKGGLAYLQIMDQIKKLGQATGLKFLIGFPNANNFLPMTRLANFKLVDSAWFVRTQKGLGPYASFLAQETKKDFFSYRLWKWRLTRFSYQVEKGRVTKMFQGEKNILDWLEVTDRDISGIFPFWSSFGKCPADFTPVDEHIIRFCCLPLDPQFNPHNLKKSILYSDVY